MTLLRDQKIEDYAVDKSEPTVALLNALAAETYAHVDYPQMLTGQLVGRVLKMLVSLIGARRVLEIGTFTGYSALCMAEGLPADGELLTCDINPQVIEIARRYFAQSEHGKKIQLLEGPALATISTLQGPFDLCFIDADKQNYLNYYEAVFPLIRRGGVILIDNVLWSGRVLNPLDDADRAICALNDRIAGDERADRVLLPIRDGIFCVRKR